MKYELVDAILELLKQFDPDCVKRDISTDSMALSIADDLCFFGQLTRQDADNLYKLLRPKKELLVRLTQLLIARSKVSRTLIESLVEGFEQHNSGQV